MASKIEPVALPKTVPVTTTRIRKPKKNIPQTKEQRDRLLASVREYVERENPVPPLPVDELRVHAERIIEETGTDPIHLDYTGVILNNELWRETLASIPYERRLLLMPKCLRVEDKCPAPFDEFGLLCKQCGLCTIQDFQNEAERLGYAVLVAEGSAVVMSLIQTGQIEAIVGVSCLPVLERTFPYVEAAAIPSVAVPLLQDDCIDTTVDNDWVWDYIHLTSEDKTRRLNLNALHEDVREWFSREQLDAAMGAAEGETEALARDWMARDGKRWRPFLTVSTFQALREDRGEPIPEDLRKVAIAVECFHKASLIHDDIEDQDRERYGEKTLHEEHGVAIALNVGDLLIGEGYRLLGDCEAGPQRIGEMLLAASGGQRELCRGQGMELCWSENPAVLKSAQVIEIFRRKTAPAFEVALQLGASYAGRLAEVSEVLHAYSEALGIAYQIRDDLDDLSEDAGGNALEEMRPSVLLAIACERAKGEARDFMVALWEKRADDGATVERVRELAHSVGADDRCMLLMETYKETAIRALQELEEANLKGLLRRVVGKIFNDLEIKGWCGEFEALNGVRDEESENKSREDSREPDASGLEAIAMAR
ncbi:MAG: polyprenyl synthetase family protein [Verrucomicrobiales bacterium]